MDRAASPRVTKFSRHSTSVQIVSNLAFRNEVLDEAPVDLTHRTDLDLRSDSQYNTIGLDAFLLAAAQFAFGAARLIYQSTTQAEAGRAALAKAEFDQPALTSEHLGG